MNGAAYLRENLAGAWLIMLGRADGLARLDTSIDGFWRSFGALVLVAPLALLALISEPPIVSEEGAAQPLTAGLFALYGVALVIDWFAFPLVFALIAPPFRLGPRYVPFIVARNWASVIIVAMVAVLHALHLLGAVPAPVMPYALLAATAVALRFAYMIARTTLFVSMALALPIVALDLVVSLTVWSIFDRLAD